MTPEARQTDTAIYLEPEITATAQPRQPDGGVEQTLGSSDTAIDFESEYVGPKGQPSFTGTAVNYTNSQLSPQVTTYGYRLAAALLIGGAMLYVLAWWLDGNGRGHGRRVPVYQLSTLRLP
jgi:hypothetical protein